ncbi:MAG: hypothetical protein GC182_08835 [Rhodopseudomonas sp.]|nr:hypothetical protein [Rhodopseudomonas sp.]
MAGWGIGIGSFASGLADGFDFGQKIAQGRQTRTLNDQKIQSNEYTLKSQQRADEEARRADAERQGALKILNPAPGIQAPSGVNPDGSPAAPGAIDAPVQTDYSRYSNMGKKLSDYYIQQGDFDKALHAEKFFDDKKNRIKLDQMGVVVGNLNDAVATGDYSRLGDNMGTFFNDLPEKVRQGATFQKLDVTRGSDGKVNGIAMTLKGKDGKQIVHNWGDEASFSDAMHTWLNPAHLIDQLTAGTTAAKKYKTDITEYATKKTIDATAGAPARRAKMIQDFLFQDQQLHKDDIPGQKASPRLTVEQAAAKADAILNAPQSKPGITAGPQQVIVDTKTGKTIPAPAGAPVAPQQSTPGIGQAPLAGATGTVSGAGQTAPAGNGQAPAAASPASITSPPPGSSPAPAPAPAAASAAPPAAAQQPQIVPAPGLGATGQRVMQPQSGAVAGPQYSDNGPKYDLGGSITRALPQIGAGRLNQINAARQSQGLAPLNSLPGQVGKGGAPLYVAGSAPPGMVKQGNIDLSARSSVKNSDGSISTVRSITVSIDGGRAVLIPTVVGDKVVSNKEAIDHFKQTGENLGVFQDEASADAYARTLHEQQEQQYVPKGRGRAAPRQSPGLGLSP